MFEIMGKTNIDFVGKRKYAFIFSGIVVLAGIIALIQIGRGSANLGIDFAGGTSVQLKFDKQIKIEEARNIIDKNGIKDVDIQEITGGNKLLIRIKKGDILKEKSAEKIVEIFQRELPESHLVVESSVEIGPTIGKKLQHDALIATAISMLGIVIYIAFRFDFKFGVAAAIATFHDIFAVIGILFLLNKEFTLLIVTAILTIAGYSLTDTVVVFDRIRENMRVKARIPLDQVINSSVNQVVSRTIITSLTTLLASLSLFLFGGEVIHDFSFALVFGVIIGTYSSVFVASPVLMMWEGKSQKFIKKQ